MPVVQFAVADDTNYTYSGVLGLGYSYPFTTKYPTLLSMMWALGFVAAPAFSIGLGGDGDGFSEFTLYFRVTSCLTSGARRDNIRRCEPMEIHRATGTHSDLAAHRQAGPNLATVSRPFFSSPCPFSDPRL